MHSTTGHAYFCKSTFKLLYILVKIPCKPAFNISTNTITKKGTRFSSSPFNLVRLAGIEPTTPWFVAKYSIQLSYSREDRDNSWPKQKMKAHQRFYLNYFTNKGAISYSPTQNRRADYISKRHLQTIHSTNSATALRLSRHPNKQRKLNERDY